MDSSSSEYVMVPNVDRVGPLSTTKVVVSSDTGSDEDLYDPYYLGTPFGGCSQ